MNLISSKQLIKRMKYKLAKLNLSFAIIGVSDWKKVYKLLKLAKKLDDDFNLPRKELKQVAKDLVAFNETNEVADTIVKLIDNRLEIIEKQIEEEKEFAFEASVLPFVEWFFNKKTVLLY